MNLTAEEYHAARSENGWPILGSSQLLAFDDDRRTFFQEHVVRDRAPRKMTSAQAVGQVLHECVLLDRTDFSEMTTQWKTRCNAHTAAEVDECRDLYTTGEVGEGLALAQTLLDPDIVTTPAADMARSFLAIAKRDRGTEHAYAWTEDGELWWKYMADIVLSEFLELDGQAWDLILDTKSTRVELDAASWRRECSKRRYHLKAAHYVRGRRHEVGRQSIFGHILIHKGAPDIAIYQLRDSEGNGCPMREGAEKMALIRESVGAALRSDDPTVWLNPHQRGAMELQWWT